MRRPPVPLAPPPVRQPRREGAGRAFRPPRDAHGGPACAEAWAERATGKPVAAIAIDRDGGSQPLIYRALRDEALESTSL